MGVIHLGRIGGWKDEVEFRADLPIAVNSPPIGIIYLVQKPTTLLGFTTFQSGLYFRESNVGSLSDWRRLNVKIHFTDTEFNLVATADNSKKGKYDLSLLTTATTRTYQHQDKDGILAHLDQALATEQEDDTVSGTVNNYALVDIDRTGVLALTLSGGDVLLTGIVPTSPETVKRLIVLNVDTSNDLKIQHNNGGSSAINRFLCPDNAEFILKRNSGMLISYDITDDRWRIIAKV